MQEIYCDYCQDFMPLETDSFTLRCANCGSTAARMNSKGHMHCGDCSQYHEPVYQDCLPLATDQDNAGYSLSDVVCPQCCGILLVIREAQTAFMSSCAAPDSSSPP